MTPRIRLLMGMALLGLLAGGCKQEPSRWDQAHQQTQGQRATTAESKAGGEFNKFFPEVQSPFDVIFKQEKQGYAEVSLQQDGAEVAVMSISDTVNNQDARTKYADSTEQLHNYPLAAIGSQSTGLLVAERYQVQVRSMTPDFTAEHRREWLEKFDLAGLSQLK